MTQEIFFKSKFKLVSITITLLFLYMSFDYSLPVSALFFMTSWIFCW